MIIKNPKFEISAVSPKQYPTLGLPEIVLVGKSNVGKSSFVNTMINRKSLARTSSEPGKTRQINFYNMDNSFYFVDLPGYGYSKMSKAEQVKVGNFIEQYLQIRKEIALIIFLIDIRHEPTANELAPTKVANAVKDLQNSLNPLKDLTFLPFSAEKKTYCEDVWKEIEKHIL